MSDSTQGRGMLFNSPVLSPDILSALPFVPMSRTILEEF